MRLLALLAACLLLATGAAPAETRRAHGIAMHGDLKYGPDFRHFDYADPAAPKGGEVRFHAVGTFDSFNSWILGGVPAGVAAATIDTLMVSSADEPFSKYCLICESVELPEDRTWIVFHLRPEARFHDGSPITADDVAWTFETIRSKGHPFFRSYYGGVKSVEVLDARRVRFAFSDATNRELPLIVGELPVFSKAWWATRDFSRPSLEPQLGSGPQRIDGFEAGRFVTLRRVPDYWGRDLPVRRGHTNFDVARYDWYRDPTVALEAFKAGEYDIRQENQALAWATRYEGPGLERGLYRKEEIAEERTNGMQGFVMNLRREQFRDARVREALAYAFDFEWSNRQLFFGAYTRTRSYFDNSELSARGLPDAGELALLEPLRAQLSPRVFTEEYRPPVSDGSGNLRENLRIATRLLREAGWQVKDGVLVDARGRPFRFDILLNQGGLFERIALPYIENLKRLGIQAQTRLADTAQYQRRLEEFDFDMTVTVFGASDSPGNEQRNYWSAAKADVVGGGNLAGIRSDAIDRLVEAVIAAPDRQALVTRTRALDRALQWSFLVVPHWHTRADRVAYWDRFGRPAVTPRVGYLPSVWWVDPAKDAALRDRRAQTR
jgi:microcin C transport system substrate-binding protein